MGAMLDERTRELGGNETAGIASTGSTTANELQAPSATEHEGERSGGERAATYHPAAAIDVEVEAPSVDAAGQRENSE
eukprot:4712758-Prymnesium_polylepis.1